MQLNLHLSAAGLLEPCSSHLQSSKRKTFFGRLSDSQGPFVLRCDKSRGAKRWLTLGTEEDASSKPSSKQI